MIIVADQHIFHAPHGCTKRECAELHRLNISGILVAKSCISTFRPRAYKKWHPEDMSLCWCGIRMKDSLPKERLRELASTFPHGDQALHCISAGLGLQSHRATGADLPPELFTLILHAMAPDYAGSRGHGIGDLRTIAACALVCRYWATTFRPLLLEHRLLNITSHNMVRSVQCMMRWKGSERIGSLRTLVARHKFRVNVYFGHSEETDPWLHHVPFLGIKAEEIHLTLTGTYFANYMRTSISPSPYGNLPIPSSACHTPFTTVVLSDFQALSFNALVKLLQRFKRARTIRIKKVAWEPCTAQGVVPLHRTAPRRNPIGAGPLFVTIAECTDCMLLCLQTCLLYPDFPLCAVSDAERNAVARLLVTAFGQVDDINMSWDGIGDTVHFKLNGTSTYSDYELAFTCPRDHEAAAANGSRDRHIKAICHRVSLSYRPWKKDNKGANTDYTKFGAALHQFPSLCNVVCCFDDRKEIGRDFLHRLKIPIPFLPEHIAFNVACCKSPFVAETAWELFDAETCQIIGV
ncbi:hypothetical protein BC835DRAFT_1374561 [Cytidiella melzeri]|nr:hypothetical protein BC835DRAFT_1374561 [Cytidiella melzeri]